MYSPRGARRPSSILFFHSIGSSIQRSAVIVRSNLSPVLAGKLASLSNISSPVVKYQNQLGYSMYSFTCLRIPTFSIVSTSYPWSKSKPCARSAWLPWIFVPKAEYFWSRFSTLENDTASNGRQLEWLVRRQSLHQLTSRIAAPAASASIVRFLL